jgi:hypothetical protein
VDETVSTPAGVNFQSALMTLKTCLPMSDGQ